MRELNKKDTSNGSYSLVELYGKFIIFRYTDSPDMVMHKIPRVREFEKENEAIEYFDKLK
jgi:hypothetical protein